MGDKCCYPREHVKYCQLRKENNAHCSSSQGSCCNSLTCNYHNKTVPCREESDCQLAQTCNGMDAKCPESKHKPDETSCQDATKVEILYISLIVFRFAIEELVMDRFVLSMVIRIVF